MPSGEKKKVPPIFAYVTQGRTDHLVVITDPTILTMIKDLGPTGWTLDQMPDQDSTFIQIKWNNTGTKQPVVVSSVKLMDEGDYGRPLPAGAGTSGRSGRSSSASTRRRSSSRSATTTTTTAATTGKGGAGTTGTAGAAAATTGKSGAAPTTTSSTSSSSSAHPPLKKRRMLAAAAAAQAAEEAQQQAAKTNPHPTDEEQETAAAAPQADAAATATAKKETERKEQDEATKTAAVEEIATQKQKKQQAEAAKQQQLQLQAEETAKKLQMKQQQEKEEAAKAAAKKDEDSKNAVAAAAAAQKNAADKAAVAKKDEEAQAAAAAKKDEDVKAAAASTKQQQQEQQAAKTKAATAMAQKIKKDRDDAKLKAEAAAFLKQQEEEKEAAEAAAKVLAAAKAKKEEAAAKEQKWFEAQQAKEAAEEVARQKQQKQNEEQERKTRLLAEVRAKAAAQQLAAEQKQQQADAAAKLAREVAKLKQQEAENKKKVHQAEQIKQEDDGLDDSDAFASDEEEDPTPAESKIPRKARTTVASSATHARSSFTNLGALSYPGGNQHSGSTGTAAAGAAGTADQGGGGSDGRDRSGSTTGGGGNGHGDQQPPPSKRFKSEEEGEYVGGNGNTNDGSGGNSDGNNNSGGGDGAGGGYEVSGADISDADKFNILMWEGNFMAAERLAEYQGRRRNDDLSFLYGYIVLDYLKHSLGYTSMKELDCTLIKALQANPFVPTYLTMIRMGDPIPPYDNRGYDVGERNEALYYVSSTEVVEVWQHIPGLLTWLEQTSNLGGTSKPPDDGRILFDLMSKGTMLVDVDPPNYGGNGAEAVLTPPKSKKLFVGGIPPDIRQDEYRDFFEQFGELRDWVVKFDGETGNSRGFGFITYVDPDVTAFVTKLGDKREGYGRLVMRGKTVEIKPHRDSRNKLFVGGLPLDVSNAELRDFFQKFGMVVDSIVMVHKDTNIPRGFGFVTYENADVTDFVLRMRDNNYMTNRDGMGRIVMRGSVLEIKEYDTSQDTRSATYAGASPAGKRLRDGGGGGEHRGPERLKVTLNLDHIKGQLPQDYRDVLSIKNYNPSRDLVCLTSDYRRGNPSTSFPYSAVRKVYFWKLLYGSGYFCHEMQHEQQPSKESNAIGYDEEEHQHRPAGHFHPDDQMMIDDRNRDRAPRSPPPPASNLKKNQAHVGEPIHTCEVCGGAHRREKCWDDPRNAHLRPADWVPSATFMAKKGVTPKRPSLSGPYGDDVSVRSGSIAESQSRSAPPGSGGASAKEEPPLKWRPPEDGEKDKRVIDGKPHTYNWQIKGWVDDTTKGFKWRAPDEDENGARVIDNKPHIYNYSIRGWVVDPNYRRGSYSQSERRRSYGDDPRRHTYGGGSGGGGGGGGDDYRRDDNRHRDDDRRGGGGHHGDDRRGSSGGDHYGGGGGGGDRYRDDDHHRGDRDRRHGGGGGNDRYRDEDRGGGYR